MPRSVLVLAAPSSLFSPPWPALASAQPCGPGTIVAGSFSASSPSCLGRLGRCGRRLELQRELHRRIDEGLHGAERNEQPFRHAVEGQADLEGMLGDREIPELVLEDDRHILRILVHQPRRNPDARRLGGEGDVEMVLAGKAGLGHFGEHFAQDAAKRVLREDVISDQVFRHAFDCLRPIGRIATVRKISGSFCCQVLPNPALPMRTGKGFRDEVALPLTQQCEPRHSCCHWQL